MVEAGSATVSIAATMTHPPRPGWMARWPGLLLVAMVAFLCCVVSAQIHGPREPWVHDELSYLLAADTFAHGRLTNPPHPMWQHFETMHVLNQPTYMSKYQPGQGLALAAGQVLTGNPEVGVWLGVALMAVALTWMLRAWLPGTWAVAGGLLAGAFFGGASDWGRTYWGGALAAAGGALVLGALKRLGDRPKVAAGILLGAGLGILAYTRPFEGLVLTAFAGAGTLIVWLKHSRPLWRQRLPALAAAAAVVAAFGIFQLVYNHAVTGRATQMPYTAYYNAYETVPLFWWQAEPPPREVHDPVVRTFWQATHAVYVQRIARGPLDHVCRIWEQFWDFFIRRAKYLPLLGLLLAAAWAVRDRAVLVIIVTLVGTVTAQAAVTYYFPHYSAPVLGALTLLAVGGVWAIWQRLQQRGWRTPPWTAPAILCLLVLASLAVTVVAARRIEPAPFLGSLATAQSDLRQRPALTRYLREVSGEPGSLVFVHYLPGYTLHEDWVFNGADIDGAPVIWARALGDDADRQLLSYYQNLGQHRRVWRLFVGPRGTPATLEPVAD